MKPNMVSRAAAYLRNMIETAAAVWRCARAIDAAVGRAGAEMPWPSRPVPWRVAMRALRSTLRGGAPIVVALVLAVPAIGEPIEPNRIRVIDGDTIRIDQAKPDHRLIGFNAPETRRAKSDAERELGNRATARLREIVRSGALDYAERPCSCRPGTEGTDRCNYGRRCGVLTADGVDVGEILIREGLAVRFVCGATGCPKMPAPWRAKDGAQ